MEKIRFEVRTKLKKYKVIDGYKFESYTTGTALSHIAYKLVGKASRYEVLKAFRKGKIRLIVY